MSVLVKSTLTDRYQTTIPDAVRKQLGLGKRDKIGYFIQDDGSVRIDRILDDDTDVALRPFLSLLEEDLMSHPERIKSLDEADYYRIKELTQGVEYDLDAPLDPENE